MSITQRSSRRRNSKKRDREGKLGIPGAKEDRLVSLKQSDKNILRGNS
jgi:hypothetical protein